MNGPPHPGSRHQVRIESIGSEGAGVGRLPDGRAVFVHRTVPGDRAWVETTRIRSRWARGKLVELYEPGPHRREAACPHYGRCGGCSLAHLDYLAQLDLKGKLVANALTRIGKRRSLPNPSLHPAPRETRYRNRISFTLVRGRGGAVTAGFHRLGDPGTIEDIDARCLLPEKVISEVWDRLRDCWGAGAARLPSGERLRLTLRSIRGSAVLLLVEGGSGGGDPEGLVREIDSLRSVWYRSVDPPEKMRLVAGEEDLSEVWCGEEIVVRPSSFLQVNHEAADQLYRRVLEQARSASPKSAVDAYCGFGVLGRRLALVEGTQVVGIEADPEVTGPYALPPVPGFRIVRGRVEEVIGEMLPADLAILNPPRAGTDSAVMEALATSPPDRILYVSCDPATLARDLHRLGDRHRISAIDVFDLFPLTARVETLVTLDAD